MMKGATMKVLQAVISVALVSAVLSTPPLQISDERDLVKDYDYDEVFGTFQEPRYRLPVTVIPSHYKVMIRPILKPATGGTLYTAPGNVTITVKCIAEGNTITLHQKALNIPLDQIQVRHLDNPMSHSASLDNGDKDFLTLTLTDNLQVDEEYVIFIPFTAKINEDTLYGMYLSTYVDPTTTETRVLATTQFQPTHAREVFPCFDEPEWKATFEISVARLQSEFHSLSNTAIKETAADLDWAGWVWDHYDDTVQMSTYLVAIIVSDFKEEVAPAGIFDKPVKVWGPPHLIDQKGGVYPAKASATIIKYFQDFTQNTYAISKLDSVAIPQFSAGAMENWGLNTYRTEYLIHIPGENTEAERKKITQVLGHEVTHQWYGNLVTCKWWDNTWLNEGFARFLQYRGMTAAAPELKTDIAIVSDATQLGMIYDAGPNTHAVLNSALSPSEVSNIFDRISYDKGASLLRMMEHVLTTPVFDESLRHYLNKTRFGTAVQDDLFESFQEVGGESLGSFTVKQFLESWTLQPGFPLVRVTSARQDNKIYLSQEKFRLNAGSVVAPPDVPVSWIIPVKIIGAANPDFSDKTPTVWISDDTALTPVTENIDTSRWLIVNPDLGGYYRVLYDSNLARLIRNQLEDDPSIISPGTRSQILEDYFQLADARYTSIESALDFTKYLGKEPELVVWAPFLTNLRKIYNKFTADASAFELLGKYFEPKIAGALDLIKWEQTLEETGADVILRAQLLDFSCGFKATKCVEYARTLFNQWVATPTNRSIILPDVRPVVYCSAVANGDQQTWDAAYDLYRTETFSATKSQLLKALACSSSEDTLWKYIQLAVDETDGLNLLTALRDVAANSVGRTQAFNYVNDNFGRGGLTAAMAATVISTLADYHYDEEFLTKLRGFIQAHEAELAEQMASLNASISKVQANMEWWKTDGSRIRSWVEANQM